MRTQNVKRNSFYALLGQAITIILKAITQMIFVRTLSLEYLGISGLFNNILNMLSLAELGIGTAILFNLYGPVANNDIERIKMLMNFYKSTYQRIGGFVMVIGLCITPFLDLLIKDTPDIPELQIIYVLYVFNNAASYFFVYKQAILIAHQENHVIFKIEIARNVIMHFGQIVILVLTRNFLLFLSIQIVCTLLFNYVNTYVAEKKYLFLKNNNSLFEKKEKRKIYKDVYATMAHKLGGVLVLGTDNLLLSMFVGVYAVGLYSNYLLFINSIKGFMTRVYDSLVSSIGNLLNMESEEKVYSIYRQLFFLSFVVTSVISIGFSCLANPLIEVFFGAEYLLDKKLVVLMSINFYFTDLCGIRAITNKFKTAKGLFWNDRYKPYVEAFINLVASVVLLQMLGFAGVLLGTLVSTLCTCIWIEPYVLFKHGLHKPLKEYACLFLKYMFAFLGAWLISEIIICRIPQNHRIPLGVMVCILIPFCFYVLLFRRTEEFQASYSLLRGGC